MNKNLTYLSPLEKSFYFASSISCKISRYMKQITEGQRYKLQAYLQAGIKKDEIARLLCIHRSTLDRELRRNKYKPTDLYDGYYGQYRYELRATYELFFHYKLSSVTKTQLTFSL